MSKNKNRSNDMEEREGTPEEVAAVAGQMGGILNEKGIAPTAPYDDSRDHDDPADHPLAENHPGGPQVQAAAAALGLGVAPTVTSDELNARMLKALESLEARVGEADSGGQQLMALAIMQLSEGLKSFRDAQIQSANIIANMQRSTVAPENKFFPDISVFNPRGEKDFPRPKLKCDMFLPWPVKVGSAEELNREEIELLNLMLPGEKTIRRSDGTKIKVTVRIDTKLDSDEANRLIVQHETAFNNDYQRLMPFDWIRQMAESDPRTRAQAKGVLTIEEELTLIAARQFNDGTHAEAGQQVVSVGA